MQSLISVIIPVYKTELYLRKCIESVINQSYKNIEIILIDDGSPDNCGKICDDYAIRDNRIKIIHKENGGLSDARNAGLDIAKGKYIGFVDSDDWIEKDMFESLYNNIVENDADIALCGINIVYVDSILSHNKTEYNSIILNNEEAIQSCFDTNGYISAYAWNKLYKRELFNDIRYPYGKYYEDVFIIIDLLLSSKRIIFDSNPKYNYRQRKSSIVNTFEPERLMDLIEARKRALGIAESEVPKCIDVVKSSLLFSHFLFLYHTAHYAKINNSKYIKYNLRELRKNKLFLLKNRYISRKPKVHMMILSISYPLYKLLSLLKMKLNSSNANCFE